MSEGTFSDVAAPIPVDKHVIDVEIEMTIRSKSVNRHQ